MPEKLAYNINFLILLFVKVENKPLRSLDSKGSIYPHGVPPGLQQNDH